MDGLIAYMHVTVHLIWPTTNAIAWFRYYIEIVENMLEMEFLVWYKNEWQMKGRCKIERKKKLQKTNEYYMMIRN